MVATVVLTPAQVGAQQQVWLLAVTLHVVQQDGASTVAEFGFDCSYHGPAAAHVPAHHVGIGQVPAIVTHCPPRPLVQDLYSALTAAVTCHQTNGWFACKNDNECIALLLLFSLLKLILKHPLLSVSTIFVLPFA